jgi:hypothetical protein
MRNANPGVSASGYILRLISFRRVDFPDPFGPRMAVCSPSFTAKEILSSIALSLMTVTLLNSSKGVFIISPLKIVYAFLRK